MKFFNGFLHAFRGIRDVFLSELNFKVHLIILSIVIGLGIYFSISRIDWIIITCVSALVLSLEAINTAIEKICNEITHERKESIRFIKDVAAGAVLIASIGAVIVGTLIFTNYISL